jgi:hypothetical protein
MQSFPETFAEKIKFRESAQFIVIADLSVDFSIFNGWIKLCKLVLVILTDVVFAPAAETKVVRLLLKQIWSSVMSCTLFNWINVSAGESKLTFLSAMPDASSAQGLFRGNGNV